MQRVDTLIIGGGQAGLAMSRSLSGRGVEHVVLERGRVGERWRSERWDSLRLLTPRWLSRLGAWPTPAGDPDGFMSRMEVVRYLEECSRTLTAPVHCGVEVTSVRRQGDRFAVRTSTGTWRARRVVIATGPSQQACVPDFATDLDPAVSQVVPTEYGGPSDLPAGGVLVVGASATGIQLAAELHAAGRPVTLAVGRHTRLPRRYRGQDILWWFHRLGMLDQRRVTVGVRAGSARQPSMQLVGGRDHADLDLGVLQERGVRLVGRAVAARGARMWFRDDLCETISAAEFKLARLRRRIDRAVERDGRTGEVAPADPFRPVPLPEAPGTLDLPAHGIRSVVWATGFRRDYPWLHLPVLDARGDIREVGGRTHVSGLYTLGLTFMRRRSSSFLAGVGADAEELADLIVQQRSVHRRNTGVAVPPRAVA